jgi:hypothetical protein
MIWTGTEEEKMLAKRQGRAAQKRLSRTFIILSLGLFVLVIGVGLSACGSNSTGSGGSTPTAAAQAQKCGTIQTQPNGNLPNTSSAQQATNCFWQSFQQCHMTSLIYTATGVDTVTTHTFTVQNNGGHCSVVDVVKHQVIPQPPSAAKTYTCSGVTQKADGLHFAACGSDGDIVVPTQTTHP